MRTMASLRATATTARLRAFLPGPWEMRSPASRRWLGGPKGPRMYWEQLTKRRRSMALPALVMGSCLSQSPD